MTRPLLLAMTVLTAVPIATAPARAQGTAPAVAIRNATVLTITNGTIEKGTIVIRNGRITAVGPDVAIPRGATEIDATGLFAMPGIIDAHSHIAVDGSVNELSLSVTSMVGIEDVLAPHDIDIYRGLAGGVTAANVLHGSGNAIGGKNAVVKLRWGEDGARPPVRRGATGNQVRARREPEARRAQGRQCRRQALPVTRMGVIDVIRERFRRRARPTTRDGGRTTAVVKASVTAPRRRRAATCSSSRSSRSSRAGARPRHSYRQTRSSSC